jgi:hypothetical protein
VPPCSFPFFVATWNRLQNQITPHVHFVIADFLEQSWISGQRHLLLMAFRACGKSTLVGLFCVWLLLKLPDVRILVLSADLALAKKMVRNVKRILEQHPLTQHLRPESADQWGADRFTIRREKELRDPSMLAKGIISNLTGTRADFIICDDVEVPKTSNTFGKREGLRERLLELDYILAPEGTQLYVGTPHCYHSIYADAVRSEFGERQIFLDGFRRLVLPILNEAGESAWPQRFPRDQIETIRKRTGPAHFSSQMMCEPTRISQGYFSADSLRFYEDELIYRESGGQAILSLGGNRMVSASVWWDPAFGSECGDRSVLAIVYSDDDGDYHVHRVIPLAISKTSSLDEATQQCRQVIEAVRDYYIPAVRLEVNGLGKFLPNVLRRELGLAGVSCSVEEMVSKDPKNERILKAFDAPLAARAIHVHRSVLKTPFVRELEDWHPEGKGGASGGHDDCLDAVAGAIAHAGVRIKRLFVRGGRALWQGGGAHHAPHDFDV